VRRRVERVSATAVTTVRLDLDCRNERPGPRVDAVGSGGATCRDLATAASSFRGSDLLATLKRGLNSSLGVQVFDLGRSIVDPDKGGDPPSHATGVLDTLDLPRLRTRAAPALRWPSGLKSAAQSADVEGRMP